MELINDFESDTVPNRPNMEGIRAIRCTKCNEVVFANYPRLEPNDYECMKCRPIEELAIRDNIKKHS